MDKFIKVSKKMN